MIVEVRGTGNEDTSRRTSADDRTGSHIAALNKQLGALSHLQLPAAYVIRRRYANGERQVDKKACGTGKQLLADYVAPSTETETRWPRSGASCSAPRAIG